MSKDTTIELVQELEKLKHQEIKARMIDLARRGEFHDFRSNAICGKHYFVECANWCLRNVKDQEDLDLMGRLIKEIINGDYDETCSELDAARIMKEVNKDPNMSERDKAFMSAAFGPKKKRNGLFGKKYF